MNTSEHAFDEEPPSREGRERVRSTYALLLEAEARWEGGALPFDDAAAHFLTDRYFLPVARRLSPKAGALHGHEQIELPESMDATPGSFGELTFKLKNRSVAEVVAYCWEWLQTPVEKTGLAPWQTILASARKQPESSRDTQVGAQLFTGAWREMLHRMTDTEPRVVLRRDLAKVLCKKEGYLALPRTDKKQPRYFHPAGQGDRLPDPGLDLAPMVDGLGRREVARSEHEITHAVLPPREQLRQFLADVFALTSCALSIRQLMKLCEKTFNLDLRPALRVELRTEGAGDEGQPNVLPGVGADTEPDASFWVDPGADPVEHEPLSILKEFAGRLLRRLEEYDHAAVDAPMDAPGRRDWLGALYVRGCLWFGWTLWDPSTRRALVGVDGKPLRYGYEKAAELLGKSVSATQEAIKKPGKQPGRLPDLVNEVLAPLTSGDREHVENLLCAYLFRLKPPFVDPARFDPKAIFDSLR